MKRRMKEKQKDEIFSKENKEGGRSRGSRRKPQRLLSSARRNVTQRIIGRNKTYLPGCLMASITGHLVSRTTALHAPDLSLPATNDVSVVAQLLESRFDRADREALWLVTRAPHFYSWQFKCGDTILS